LARSISFFQTGTRFLATERPPNKGVLMNYSLLSVFISVFVAFVVVLVIKARKKP
jgi:hypothetical protein